MILESFSPEFASDRTYASQKPLEQMSLRMDTELGVNVTLVVRDRAYLDR